MKSISRTLAILTGLFLFIPMIIEAQSNINVKTNAWVLNTENLDELSYTPGLIIAYDFFLRNRSVSGRLSSFSFFQDGDLRQALGAAIHYSIYHRWKNAINIHAGISWESRFADQRFGPILPQIMTGIEFNRSVNAKWDFSVSAAYSLQDMYPLALGLRYWISKDIRKRKPCLSCPD